ncbi:MAG: NADH:flavin oxidoreductase [Gemmatimonadota bacterium]|nr:NADH:flavin oxidoreductase [Gemmatimonadota bacterium]
MSGQPSTQAAGAPAERRAFTPFRLAGLPLRNRIIKSATYEGMTPAGRAGPALVEHHAELARGGVGLTTVAYAAVASAGRTFAEQLLMDEDQVERLKPLTDAVHRHGGAASLQLTHSGGFTKYRAPGDPPPAGPSRAFNAYGSLSGLPWIRAMSEADIAGVVTSFADAAGLAKRAGFDAVELHLGHGYLLSQFLSPAINRRTDAWGGSLSNRLRLPVAVVRAVRERMGEGFPILCKINLSDGFPGGLGIAEAVGIARALAGEGVDALVLSAGFVSRSPFYLLRGGRPLREMIAAEPKWSQKAALGLFGPVVVRPWPFTELFLLDQARRVREAVDIPLALLGGVSSRDNLATAMREGFELVAVARALIANPTWVRDLEAGTLERTRCNRCNVCIAEMDRGGVRCVL